MEKVSANSLKDLKDEIIVVDCYADWCKPCGIMSTVLESIEPNYPNIKFVKVNIDNDDDYATEMGVRGLPTVIFFNKGVKVHTVVGTKSPEDIKEILNDM